MANGLSSDSSRNTIVADLRRISFLVLFAMLSVDAVSADSEWQAAELVKPYLTEYIAAIENEFIYDSDGNFIGPSPHWREADRLLYEILEDQSPEGDEAVAYLLFLYTGEHAGGVLVCEASRRGDRMLPIIEEYQKALPETGMEPYPDGLKGSGYLPPRALELIRAGESCRH